jgi:serine/threonine-protein kinase RsbT
VQLKYKIAGGDFANAGNVASSLKKVLRQLNISPQIIKKIVISVYEGEVNIVAHAYSGDVTIDIEKDKLRILLKDSGPGIADIDKAMEAGFSTASLQVREMGFGAGMGLPNMKKNSDILNINSVPGKGTELELITYFSKNA